MLACFSLYCRIPFGRFHRLNPEIIDFANAIRRTPSAVAMKLSNFASFDPAHKRRNVRGLSNASDLDREIWADFENSPNRIAAQSEEAFNKLATAVQYPAESELKMPEGPTEKPLTRPMRLVQSFFRRTVLSSYGYRCTFCRLPVRALLTASHIIPWNASVELRADPRNGLCLCTLHDRAFDRGLMGVNSDFCVLVSPKLKQADPLPIHKIALLDLDGIRIELPRRFAPRPECLEHHRQIHFPEG